MADSQKNGRKREYDPHNRNDDDDGMVACKKYSENAWRFYVYDYLY